MTLRLILTRHAKSSWNSPALDDHDRPLNDRGRAAARAVGKWLRENRFCPNTVISSTARRTAETWSAIAQSCQGDSEVQFTSALYLASPEQMLRVLKNSKGESVLLLGHNPGTAMLAEALVQNAPTHPKFTRYPTAATTVIAFDAGNWADVVLHSGQVDAFIVPKELEL